MRKMQPLRQSDVCIPHFLPMYDYAAYVRNLNTEKKIRVNDVNDLQIVLVVKKINSNKINKSPEAILAMVFSIIKPSYFVEN